MNTQLNAMRQALEALERYSGVDQRACDAEDALRTAIEAAERQEPVGEVVEIDTSDYEDGPHAWVQLYNDISLGTVLYTTPPAAQRQWVGLSEEEIDKLKHLIDWTATWSHGRFAYEIEQLLKEKNA